MKKALVLFIVLAIVGAAIYISANSAMKRKEDRGSVTEVAASNKKERVIVAAKDLERGKIIEKTDLTLREIPAKYVQSDAFIYTKDSDIEKIQHKFATAIALSQGSQLTKGALKAAQDAGANARVQVLWRGQFLEVPTYVVNSIGDDSVIDVLLTFNAILRSSGREEGLTATMLQRVKVLSKGIEGEKGFLFLSVDPRDAQYLALAKSEGTVEVIVRNSSDLVISPLPIASFSNLFGPAEKKEEVVKEEPQEQFLQ